MLLNRAEIVLRRKLGRIDTWGSQYIPRSPRICSIAYMLEKETSATVLLNPNSNIAISATEG
jgi:hypothetical protein